MNFAKKDSAFQVKTSVGEYPIYIKENAIYNIDVYIDLADKKALIVTDSGVPADYALAVKNGNSNRFIITIPQGEQSKNMQTLQLLLTEMAKNGFTRSDCVIAVGGGVVGDLAGFAASMFMRGVNFYNIPTTLLSQVDSSVGGKTAVDFMGIKNLVGAFYPPKAVIIDPSTLKTLPKRQISNGLAESLKMSLTNSETLFSVFENGDPFNDLERIITESVGIKKSVVEADETEQGLRRVLNFGHTLGHAVESANGMQNYYHGECVAMGMVPMCGEDVKQRLISVLKKLNLPYELPQSSVQDIISACGHDKKLAGKNITLVFVPQIGSFKLKTIPLDEYTNFLREVLPK